jgi:hypothetical protein
VFADLYIPARRGCVAVGQNTALVRCTQTRIRSVILSSPESEEFWFLFLSFVVSLFICFVVVCFHLPFFIYYFKRFTIRFCYFFISLLNFLFSYAFLRFLVFMFLSFRDVLFLFLFFFSVFFVHLFVVFLLIICFSVLVVFLYLLSLFRYLYLFFCAYLSFWDSFFFSCLSSELCLIMKMGYGSVPQNWLRL